MFSYILLAILVLAAVYHERRVRTLERAVGAMGRKPEPVTEDGDSRNVGEIAVELHERRHHPRGK